MFSEGYIGFTSADSSKRWCEHVFDSGRNSQYPIHRAIRKYGKDLEFKVICIGSAEYCLEIERKLRPSRNIGWNVCVGGGAPGLGRILTAEHRAAVSRAQKGRIRTAEERLKVSLASTGRFPSAEIRAKLSASAKAKVFKPEHKKNISMAKRGIPSTNGAWMHPRADHGKWRLAGQFHDLYKYGFGRIPSSTMLGYNGDAFKQIVKRIQSGWNPWEDAEYSNWKTKDM